MEALSNDAAENRPAPWAAPHIEDFSDERASGDGIIVTLRYGYSFVSGSHEGVWGFDTMTEARNGTRLKRLYRCRCDECKAHTS